MTISREQTSGGYLESAPGQIRELQVIVKDEAAVHVPRAWIFALAALLLVYVTSCPVPRLFDQIDGQYAGAAREMILRNDWLIPSQDGVPRLQKPPLVYWCEILSMRTFGISEFSARLPVALATVAWFLATGLVARRAAGSVPAGIAASMALSMCVATFFFTHLVMPEPFICCFLSLAFWAFLNAMEAGSGLESNLKSGLWLTLVWLFIALGTFSKGIHAVLIPVASFSIAAFFRPTVRPAWRRFLLCPSGWALFLAIVLPWYLAVEARYPGFLRDHFFNEQIGSALSHRWPPDNDRVPLAQFWAEQLVLLFPVILLLPCAITATLRRRRETGNLVSDQGLILLTWFMVVGIGISLSNIQDYYLAIAWAPVAVWIGWAVATGSVSFRWPAVIIGCLGIAGFIAAAVAVFAPWSDASAGAENPGLEEDTIANVFQILPETVSKEAVPLLCAIASLGIISGVAIFLLDRKNRKDLCFAGFGFMMAVFFVFGTRGLQIVEDQFSSEKIGQTINAVAGEGSKVIAQCDPNDDTTLFFYVHHLILWVDGHPDMEFATRTLGIGRSNFLSHEEVAKLWQGAFPVFLIVERSTLADWIRELHLTPEQSAPVARCGSRVVLENR